MFLQINNTQLQFYRDKLLFNRNEILLFINEKAALVVWQLHNINNKK